MPKSKYKNMNKKDKKRGMDKPGGMKKRFAKRKSMDKPGGVKRKKGRK